MQWVNKFKECWNDLETINKVGMVLIAIPATLLALGIIILWLWMALFDFVIWLILNLLLMAIVGMFLLEF